MTLGEIAYQAYADSLGWEAAYTGQALQQWTDLKPQVREAWEAAAAAVRIETIDRAGLAGG